MSEDVWIASAQPQRVMDDGTIWVELRIAMMATPFGAAHEVQSEAE